MGAHKTRSNPEQMAEKADTLLAHLDACARHGHVCPGLGRLAVLLRLRSSTIYDLFKHLRSRKLITWKVVYCGTGLGKVRVVTITATGHTTAQPKMAKRSKGAGATHPNRPAFTPTEKGSPVRTLKGAEFEFWKNHYEARDRAERARAI